ncbi:hypothetical protein CJ030_MR7G016707 [Morella rubra]|uniref:Fungal lipase-type domain-containing protein n=1 Tax=Morella rubra TaxID=262757 RepID=A0A6A1UXL0_9ROSI|nr:hypothetical protein CJ030_MR7G016707 [Morella rubra]
MRPEREIFGLSGPTHLTAVDWTNTHHRRSVAASLVAGVYGLERDRRKNRHGPIDLALPWWEFFHFQVFHVLKDDVDSTIFGAVYEFKDADPAPDVPKYVIAFRGTILQPDNAPQDIKLNFKCFRNKLHESSRFQLAIQYVEKLVALAANASVWLAGHSLGSSIALLAVKNTVLKMDYFIETYLFNPPFLTASIEWIKEERVKEGIRFASGVVKAGLSLTADALKHREYNPFVLLAGWSPHLFVNPDDPVSSEYIGYFEHRKKMEEIGAGNVERLAAQNTMRNIIKCAAKGRELEVALHLLPSAYLTTNLGKSPSVIRAHAIEQWWNPDIHCTRILHQFQK